MQLRLTSARIVAAANRIADTDAVRTVRVLAVGTTTAPEPGTAQAAAPAAAVQAPVKTREMASPGYHQALAAHREAAAPRRVDPAIAEAVEWWNAAMRALSHRTFPDGPDDPGPTPIEQARIERRRQAAATEAAAPRRAREDRAARTRNPSPDTGVQVTHW